MNTIINVINLKKIYSFILPHNCEKIFQLAILTAQNTKGYLVKLARAPALYDNKVFGLRWIYLSRHEKRCDVRDDIGNYLHRIASLGE